LITIAQLPQIAGAADEVELQRRVLLLADLVEGDEQRHPVGFLELVGLHARRTRRLLGVVAEHIDRELAVDGIAPLPPLLPAGALRGKGRSG
jgi:hypothetical protein